VLSKSEHVTKFGAFSKGPKDYGNKLFDVHIKSIVSSILQRL
jgi:hypothetical protein